MNLKEASEILGVKPSFIRKQALSGNIKYYRIGRFIKISEEDLNEYIKSSYRGKDVSKD